MLGLSYGIKVYQEAKQRAVKRGHWLGARKDVRRDAGMIKSLYLKTGMTPTDC